MAAVSSVYIATQIHNMSAGATGTSTCTLLALTALGSRVFTGRQGRWPGATPAEWCALRVDDEDDEDDVNGKLNDDDDDGDDDDDTSICIALRSFSSMQMCVRYIDMSMCICRAS
jgi:hypothetical protein